MTLYTPRHFATADELAVRRVPAEHGFATLITSAGGIREKRAIVDELSARHEASPPNPWTSAQMDPALERMLGAIVGFRFAVERIDAKFKLSQNRSAHDRAGVIAGLEGRGQPASAALAAWMLEFAKP